MIIATEENSRFSKRNLLFEAIPENLYTNEERDLVQKHNEAYLVYKSYKNERDELLAKCEENNSSFGYRTQLRRIKKELAKYDRMMTVIEQSSELKGVLDREHKRQQKLIGEWYRQRDEEKIREIQERHKQARAEIQLGIKVRQEVIAAMGLNDSSLSAAESLAIATVMATHKMYANNTDSYICKSKLACADSVLFSCFVVRAMCISTATSRLKAQQFSNEFVFLILSAIEKLYIHEQSQLNRLFDNRMALYDRAFLLQDNPRQKILAVIEQFEIFVKADAYYNFFLEFSENSPLPLLEVEEEFQCQTDIAAFNDFLTSIIKSDLSNMQQYLQNNTL